MKILMTLMLTFIPTYFPESLPDDAGTYEVRLEYDSDPGIETSLNLTILTAETIIKDNRIAIDAHSFYIEENTKLTNEIILDKSNVVIWDLNTYEEYDVKRIETIKNADYYNIRLYVTDDFYKDIQAKILSPEDYYIYDVEEPVYYENPTYISTLTTINFIAFAAPFLFLIFLILIYFINRFLIENVNEIHKVFKKGE